MTTATHGVAPDGRRRARRPRVAFLVSNFWPEPTGSSQTVTEFAEFLADRGADVHVATSMPWYPQWEIWPEYRGRLWRTDTHRGMTIHRTWHVVSPRPSTVTRLLHEATVSLLGLPNMVRALRGAKTAVVVVPLLSYAFVASLLATVAGARLVLLVKDVLPDAAIELGMLRNPAMIALSRWMARQTYRLADEIHTLGEGMRRRIARVAGPGKVVRIVPDTIDAAELAPVPREANEFRRRFVPDGVFAVVHTGNMGRKQDLDLLVRTAERLRGDAGVRFYVFGDGADKDRFVQRVRDAQLGNVEHHPLQERWLLPHMLCGADAVLVSQLREVVDIAVPSKLLTALAAGALIVVACAADSEAARLVRDSGGGIMVPASDDAALAEQLVRIRGGAVDVCGFRERARAFAVRTFGRGAVYGPLAEELLGPRPAAAAGA